MSSYKGIPSMIKKQNDEQTDSFVDYSGIVDDVDNTFVKEEDITIKQATNTAFIYQPDDKGLYHHEDIVRPPKSSSNNDEQEGVAVIEECPTLARIIQWKRQAIIKEIMKIRRGTELKQSGRYDFNQAENSLMNQSTVSDIRGIVAEGADINTRDQWGQTLLHQVTRIGDMATVRVLIEELGADVNVGDELGRTPLRMAADSDHEDLQNYLSSKGAQLENKSWLANKKLEELFVNSRVESADISRQEIVKLLRQGASIQMRDQFGQTLLHEVARSFSVNMAQTLIEEFGANVNAADEWGRTALHVAAAMNHVAMCEFFLAVGADREALTKEQCHTPLFFAATHDAPDTLTLLHKMGCNIEARDFKGRTPLFAAAEFDRTESAKTLLELGANSHVQDSSGKSVLVPLIIHMPAVALTALDQFHHTNRQLRKQRYYFSELEGITRREDISQSFPSPMECMVSINTGHDLVMHSAVDKLISYKWDKFARKRVGLEILFQVTATLIWSVFALLIDWKANPVYGPKNNWTGTMVARLVLFLLACLYLIYEVSWEIVEFIQARKIHERYRAWRISELRKDLFYCHPCWRHEADYIKCELHCVTTPYNKSSYFNSKWNWYDISCYAMLLLCIDLHIAHWTTCSLMIGRYQVRFLSIGILMLWIRLFKLFRAVSFFGATLIMLGYLIRISLQFLFVYLMFYIPFAVSFWILFGGRNPSISEYNSDVKVTTYNASNQYVIQGFDRPDNLLFTLMTMTIKKGEFSYEDFVNVDRVTAQLIIGFWFTLSGVVLIYIYIALLSDTFNRIFDNAKANATMLRTRVIIDKQREIRFFPKGCLNSLSNYYESLLHLVDRPMTELYDDDFMKPEEPEKAALQIRRSLKELRAELKLTEMNWNQQQLAINKLSDSIDRVESHLKSSLDDIRRMLQGMRLNDMPSLYPEPIYPLPPVDS